ncbi:hypothetical protein Q8A73_021297 [Channa argus]|nr:hypothetical protein Q8A73_021297 [Channa argus]
MAGANVNFVTYASNGTDQDNSFVCRTQTTNSTGSVFAPEPVSVAILVMDELDPGKSKAISNSRNTLKEVKSYPSSVEKVLDQVEPAGRSKSVRQEQVAH